MDKILQSVSDPNNMRITITNDGATILKAVPVENPAAKVLVDIAKVQDDTVGDGTTSSGMEAVLSGFTFPARNPPHAAPRRRRHSRRRRGDGGERRDEDE